MGTPPPTSRTAHEDRSLDGVVRDNRVGRGLRRPPLSPPLSLALSPSAHKPASARVGGPRVAPLGNSSSRTTEAQSPRPPAAARPEGLGPWVGDTGRWCHPGSLNAVRRLPCTRLPTVLPMCVWHKCTSLRVCMCITGRYRIDVDFCLCVGGHGIILHMCTRVYGCVGLSGHTCFVCTVACVHLPVLCFYVHV